MKKLIKLIIENEDRINLKDDAYDIDKLMFFLDKYVEPNLVPLHITAVAFDENNTEIKPIKLYAYDFRYNSKKEFNNFKKKENKK